MSQSVQDRANSIIMKIEFKLSTAIHNLLERDKEQLRFIKEKIKK